MLRVRKIKQVVLDNLHHHIMELTCLLSIEPHLFQHVQHMLANGPQDSLLTAGESQNE